MEILILQYSLAVLACLWWIKPFKNVVFGKKVKIPMFNLLCFLILAFIGSYTFLHEIKAGLGDVYKIAFLVLNMLLFCLVPAGYLYLKSRFEQREFQRPDIIHLLPCIVYLIWFALPAAVTRQEDEGLVTGNYLFTAYGYFIMGLYILLLVKFLFERYGSTLLNFFKKNSKSSIVENKANALNIKLDDVLVGTVHLTPEQLSKMDETVRNLFVTKQPFLQRGYSLKQLSEDTFIPIHHLSAFINQYYNIHFNDLVNEYRVQCCQIKIRNEEWRSKTLETIAEESGFNNRNTFTIAFKKVTGTNPSDFLKKVKLNQVA